MEWYIKVWKQYADFSGRARRKEYWMFTLFNIIFFMLSFILGDMLGLEIGVIYMLYTLAVIIPSLAVCIRRLHDIGKSGWNYLIGLIPLIGGIILIVWFCTDSQAGENKWGANPKLATSN